MDEGFTNIYINSSGGSTTGGFAIFDTMQHIKPDVNTICIGMAASFGAMFLLVGTKGKRFALPNSEIMIHLPLVEYGDRRRKLKLKEHINGIIAERTGQPIEKITNDNKLDYFMSTEVALQYGIIDKVGDQ